MMQKEKDTWKYYHENIISHSGAHYLMAIHAVFERQGYARLVDISKELDVSMGSLSTSLRPLIQKGLIVQDSHKHLTLSEEGLRLTQRIESTHHVFQFLLHDVLGVDKHIANVDACKVEHLLSNESVMALVSLVQTLENNPDIRTQLAVPPKDCQNSCNACGTLCVLESLS